MNLFKLLTCAPFLSLAGMCWSDTTGWVLMDDFQQFNGGEVFAEATGIGWHGYAPRQPEPYWIFEDPFDPGNMALYVESASRAPTWAMKELPGGGIGPGETGTYFFRCFWSGLDASWQMGTADKPWAQLAQGAGWGDWNAEIRLGTYDGFSYRSGNHYIQTNPRVIPVVYEWYSFWIVVENFWDMSTTPPTSTGTYSLYVQGEGVGDGLSPTLIPRVIYDPGDTVVFARAPVDDDGNPRAITWAVFQTSSGATSSPNDDDLFLLDDFYFSPGENLTIPVYVDDASFPAAPSNLEATIISSSQIQLTWQDNASNETGFRVLTKGGFWEPWIEVAEIPEANASSYLLGDMDTRQPQRMIVQAINATGAVRSTNIATASWKNPVLVGAELNTANIWELDWLGRYTEFDWNWIDHEELGLLYLKGQDASGFHVYSPLLECWFWTTNDIFPWFYKYGSYAGWYFYFSGAVNYDRWFARLSDGTYVRAPYINDAIPIPAAPSNLEAEFISASLVRLTWTDNSDYEVGFKIFMKTGEDGEWMEVAKTENRNQSQYFLTGVSTDRELRFKVQAYKIGSESDFSNVALAEVASTGFGSWMLIDDFQAQAFSDGDIFFDATDIGWHACSTGQTDEYWMLQDPLDPENIAMYVESGNYGIGYGTTWVMKALPDGGIQPGETGTIYFRSLWAGYDNNWHMATADKPLAFDEETGLQTAPGAWGDLNALIRLGASWALEHRDGDAYVATNPPQVPQVNEWYNFWMVVDNTWDMTTSPPACTGIHTLYVQGEGFGDGISPVLIPVGTDPPKDSASLRRPPADDEGNPRAIIWAVFATNSGPPSSGGGGDPFLLDDFYFSRGENLTRPK